jgi:hypothetical protein
MESQQASRTAGGESCRTCTSGLSMNEFACVRAVGFEPVGQVMGASVYSFDPGLGGVRAFQPGRLLLRLDPVDPPGRTVACLGR